MTLNNLEHLKFGEITNQSGSSYATFRRSLKPVLWRVWFDIILLYGLQIGFFVFMYQYLREFTLTNVLITLIISIFIGFFLASLNLFIHEAAHYNIHNNKKTNDILANIFIGIWFGMNVKSYRIIHWQHHEKLGTVDDTEHSYFNALNWKFILSTLFGIHLVRILLFRNKNVAAATTKNPDNKSLDKIMFFSGILLNLSLLCVAYYLGNYFWIPAWIIGMFSIYPFFNSVRQLLEHRDEQAKAETDYSKVPHGIVSRFFNLNLFSYFFGGAGFDKHLLHHWDPQISYTRLKDVEEFLSTNQQCNEIITKSRTNYLTTFLKLLK